MTTTYSVRGPDGQVHQFSGPDGATPDQVMSVAQQQFGGGSEGEPAAPQHQPTPEEAAFAAGRASGRNQSALTAGISQAAQQGTFGLQNYLNAGARYIGQHLLRGADSDSFDTDLAYSRGQSQGQAEGHPVASTVGGTAGTFLGGAGAAKLLKLAPGGSAVSRFISPSKAAPVANVAKAGGIGAAAGGTQALAEGQPLPQAAQTAAVSAVAAPVAGKVMSFGLDRLQPAGRKAMQALADTLDESPQVLQQAYDTFAKLTGRAPSMAEVTNLKSQGALRKLASANATVGDAALKAANLGNAPLHEQLAAMQGASKPQTLSGIHELRDAETDAAMSTPHPTTGVALRDTPVNDPTGILLSPHIDYALRPNTVVNNRLNQTSTPFYGAKTNTATIGDVDTIRKALRDMQSSFMRPAPGSAHARDPALAKEFGDIANKVEQLGVNADPDYGLVLQNYRNASNYGEGFAHGLAGNAAHDVPEGDSRLASALKSQHGIAGYEHGNALHNAAQALDTIRPGSVSPQGASVGPSHVAQGAMAASSGGISAIYHAMRAIPGLHLSPKVQDVIAKQLFDPHTAQQGINNLRRAGVDADNLRQIVGMTGLAAGVNTGRYLTNNE